MQLFGIIVLEKDYPDAYKALPKSYQEESVLEFWVMGGSGNLYCQPTRDQEKTLGNWAAIFQDGAWIDLRDFDTIARRY